MGVWSTNVFLGSLLGTLIPAMWATPSGLWRWFFITPALILLVMALVTSLLLVPGDAPHPRVVAMVACITLAASDPRVVGMESPLVHVSAPVGQLLFFLFITNRLLMKK